MNKNIGLLLITFGVLLAGLGYLVHHLEPALARTTLITALAGGILSLCWGLLALLGNRRKVFAMLTLIPVGYLLLGQAILNWRGAGGDSAHHGTAILLIALMFALCLAMLIRVAYEGVAFNVPPETNRPK